MNAKEIRALKNNEVGQPAEEINYLGDLVREGVAQLAEGNAHLARIIELLEPPKLNVQMPKINLEDIRPGNLRAGEGP